MIHFKQQLIATSMMELAIESRKGNRDACVKKNNLDDIV